MHPLGVLGQVKGCIFLFCPEMELAHSGELLVGIPGQESQESHVGFRVPLEVPLARSPHKCCDTPPPPYPPTPSPAPAHSDWVEGQ